MTVSRILEPIIQKNKSLIVTSIKILTLIPMRVGLMTKRTKTVISRLRSKLNRTRLMMAWKKVSWLLKIMKRNSHNSNRIILLISVKPRIQEDSNNKIKINLAILECKCRIKKVNLVTLDRFNKMFSQNNKISLEILAKKSKSNLVNKRITNLMLLIISTKLHNNLKSSLVNTNRLNKIILITISNNSNNKMILTILDNSNNNNNHHR